MRTRIAAVPAFATLTLLAALTTAARAQSPVPLFDNLGTLTHPISTRVPMAQRYFDQGLRLTYGFNHAEAIRAFREAARLDSTCAICWWGAAYAWGPNINIPMDSAGEVAAWDALQHAVVLRAHASPAEQAYIDALARRYSATPLADRPQHDSAYATAMREVARRFPADPDAATMAAEAGMELRPWNYWTPDGTAQPGVDYVLQTLEGVLRRTPNHPGACHFYIHAVEASKQPERALPCADRLSALMPGAGHLVHMPAHIYLRLGLYDRAVTTNIHAAHADETYIADQHPDGVYPMGYYPHNLHFLWAAAAFEGRKADADDAMRRLRAVATPELAQQVPPLEVYVVPVFYHMVWFGEWDQILREPRPPAALVTTSGMWHYARGRAFAATNRLAEARQAMDSLASVRTGAADHLPPGITTGFATPAALLAVAQRVLAGEIAARERRWDDAIAELENAVQQEDALAYDEPSDWYPAARLSLGAVLLAANRAAAAEAVYRSDLARHPNSGWSLLGLALSLEAQNKTSEATRARAEFRRAWARSDITPAASQF